jgi:prepilin-type N-terminal cleavage/methylation domain-containing protein
VERVTRRRSRFEAAGFTLVETVIALTVLGMCLLGIVGLVRLGMSRTSYSKLRGEATELVRQEVDRLQSLDFTQADLSAGPHQRIDGAHTIQWTVTNDMPVAGAKKLLVTVSWKNPALRNENFSVATYLVDRP